MSQKDEVPIEAKDAAFAGTEERTGDGEADEDRLFCQSNQMQSSLLTTGALWRKENGAWPAGG